MDVYLVGGAVRDRLLGKPDQDRDWVVVGATPQQMLAQGFRQVGADFPVFLHPETHEEYALARTERKQGHGYHGFAVYSAPDVTLEDDLQRRDLTINAMAQAQDGTLVDPFDGRRDLERRILRHVSPAFAEDPLRILRLARFAARFAPLDFTIAPETLELMKSMVNSGEVDHLVPERVWQETRRALHENTPRRYFEVLRSCGALRITMPELDNLFEAAATPGPGPASGPGEPGLQRLTVSSLLSEETAVRFAALVQDLSPDSLHDLSGRLKVPNDCRELAQLATRLRRQIHQAPTLDADAVMAIFDQADAWRRPERFAQLLVVCEADASIELDSAAQPAYPAARFLANALAAAQQVQARQFLDQGLKGKKLGEAIKKGRRAQIQEIAGQSPDQRPSGTL